MSTQDTSGAARVGAAAPDFSRVDHAGREVRLSGLRGRPVVVFFYPKDHTPVCTAQACAFRDAFADLSAAGAVVIGVSSDSDESHRGFAAKRALPYHLVSDADGSLAKLWGVERGLLGLAPGRATYVLDQGGVVREVFRSWWRAGAHAARALEVVRGMGTAAEVTSKPAVNDWRSNGKRST